jgi:hypothetical protein
MLIVVGEKFAKIDFFDLFWPFLSIFCYEKHIFRAFFITINIDQAKNKGGLLKSLLI